MFGHFPELVIILVIALIVFGPEKLPEVAANAGKMMREVREVFDSAMNPREAEPKEDFAAYYYESLARSDEEVPMMDDEGMYVDHSTDPALDEAPEITPLAPESATDLPHADPNQPSQA